MSENPAFRSLSSPAHAAFCLRFRKTITRAQTATANTPAAASPIGDRSIPGAPQVIFATAFDAHAIRAFDLAAVDYLLKPWDAERLLRALDRARQRRATGHPPVALPPGLGGVRRVLVRDDDALRPLDCANILAIQARDNQVVLHTAERDWLLREPLGALLARLQAPDLLRVHRSHAVNLRHVREMLPLHKGDGDLILSDGRRVPYSRTCREALLKALAG